MERSVKSATRVFDLMEVFERERRPLRVAELVEALDAPQSSVSMLCKTLVSEGYMELNPTTREYCPSMRVANLWDWVTHLPYRPKAITEVMRGLAAGSGETILLGRVDGFEVQYVSAIHSRHAVRFVPTAGTRRPLHRTAIGIVLLSTMSDARIGLLLRRYNAELGVSGTPANLEATMREVNVARDQGYYQSGGLATPGAGVIAKLLPTSIREQRLAVGVGAPLDRLQLHKRKFLDLITEAVAEC
jgi:DNA-binding IclR family transcriptional regulator